MSWGEVLVVIVALGCATTCGITTCQHVERTKAREDDTETRERLACIQSGGDVINGNCIRRVQ